MDMANGRIGLRFGLTAMAILLSVGFFVSGCEDPGSYGDVEPVVYGRLVAYASAVEPPMDNPRHEIWRDPLTGGIFVSDSAFIADPDSTDSLPVSLKAIKTAQYLYLRAEWGEDAIVTKRSYSVWQRPAVHSFKENLDTLGNIIDTAYDFWSRRSFVVDTIIDLLGKTIYDTVWLMQDGFAIIWDAGNNGDEKADCRTMCHDPADTLPNGHRMYTTEGGNADVWHWQAGTTDPVLLAQDEFWSSAGREVDAFAQEIFTVNFDTVVGQPIYMHQDTAKVTDPLLHADQTVAFDSTRTWRNRNRVPAYVVHNNALGSTADVDCYSSFNRSNGRWMVLMRRALDTGNSGDDVNLADINGGDSIMVTIAFMNHNDSFHHGSRPFYIIFP